MKHRLQLGWRIAITAIGAAVGAVVVAATLDQIDVREAGSKLNMDETSQVLVVGGVLVLAAWVTWLTWKFSGTLGRVKLPSPLVNAWIAGVTFYALAIAVLIWVGAAHWLLFKGGILLGTMPFVFLIGPAVALGTLVSKPRVNQ